MRRRPWMLFGWGGAIIILFVLSIKAQKLSVEVWLILLLLVRIFEMFADVAADAYCIELGQREPPGYKG